MTDRTDTLPEPLGWAILDKGGIVTEWRVRLSAFFGGVLENAAPDSDHIARRDRESPGLAPHRVVAVYDEDAADTVRHLLAEQAEHIRVLTEALQQIRALDYRNAATNGAAYGAHNIAAAALEARNG